MTSVTPIRPSQFMTRNGPGSLVSTVEGAILIPQLTTLVKELLHTSSGSENFKQPDANGNTSLNKFEILDSRMERMLRYFNSKEDKPFEKDIRIFSLPTNVDLRIKETRNILSGFVFPRWGICTQHNGYSILMKFIAKSFDEIILDCPKCRKQGLVPIRGVPVRFIQACSNGHLQDIYWPSLVHGGSKCSNQIFEWRDIGGDNFIIKCIKCNKQADYIGTLKTRSIYGGLKCDGQFPEREIRYNPNNSCEQVLDDKGKLVSRAKLMLRNSSGLHTPKNLISVQIPKFSGQLYRELYPHRTALNGFINLVDNWDKNKLVNYLKSIKKGNQISDDTIYEVERTSEDELVKSVNDIIDELNQDANLYRQQPISESESNDEELASLLEAARTGYPPTTQIGQKRAYVNIEDIILIESKEFGVTFRISPIRELRVIKTQVAYSREISSVGDNSDSTQSRIGILVRKSCYYEDGNTRWYLGDENFGEGLFIDIVKSKIDEPGGLNPVDNSSSEEIDTWLSINNKLDDLLAGKEDDEELRQEVTQTNPRFVWWHTLCHKLLLNLTVDSGFSIVSFGEQVYCKKDKHNGKYQSGILMFTSATGSDGTLGGLVGLAKEEFMIELFKKSAQGIISCSNDPVCSERKIALDKREGACCHACELLSETTCDYQNRNLDRNLVMDTMP